MGREARAACRWGEDAGMVTALLEGDVLLVRGDIRATIARSAVRDVEVVGVELRFLAGDVPVALSLGTTAARRWATALASPPPTLAQMLGITDGSRVRSYGDIDDEALAGALAVAADVHSDGTSREGAADVVLIRADGARELSRALDAHLASPDANAPLWVAYRKGKNQPMNEAAVRAAVRQRGLVDTKIAGVSSVLTALRFTPKAAAPAVTPRVASPPRRLTGTTAPGRAKALPKRAAATAKRKRPS